MSYVSQWRKVTLHLTDVAVTIGLCSMNRSAGFPSMIPMCREEDRITFARPRDVKEFKKTGKRPSLYRIYFPLK